jgi:hypothetical protein
MSRRIVLAVIAAFCALGAAPVQANDDGGGWRAELLTLNFREAGTPAQPLGDGAAGPVSTTSAFAAGRYALVVVAGSVSAFQPNLWEAPAGFHVCGTPDSQPIFKTPDVTNGKVGTDAEYNFGRPFPNRISCPPAFPRHQSLFEMDFGDGFKHYEPVAGKPTGYLAHFYAYFIKTQGARVGFREEDSNTTDNYGMYKILVLGKADCSNNGWKYMQPMSNKSQKECEDKFDRPTTTSAVTRTAEPAPVAPYDDGMGNDGAPFE